MMLFRSSELKKLNLVEITLMPWCMPSG